MFSTFPDGWPGTGLILLRLVCGALLTAQAVAYVSDWPNLRLAGCALVLVSLASGILLLLGCLTRVAAVVAAVVCASDAFSWLPALRFNILTPRLPCLLLAAIAVAVICLGPGAFSLDALIFGRREVVIPASHSDL